MTAFTPAPVVVWRDDTNGTIHIGAVDSVISTGVLTWRLWADGADLIVSLDDMMAPPYAVVDEPDHALWWLEYVYGESVAEEVRRLNDPEENNNSSDPVEAIAGFLASPVMRFALGLWLLHWWPSRDAWSTRSGQRGTQGLKLTPEGESWLRTELGTLAWYAEDVFGGKDLASTLLANEVGSGMRAASDSIGGRPLAIVRALLETVRVEPETYWRLRDIESGLLSESSIELDNAIAQFQQETQAPEKEAVSAESVIDVDDSEHALTFLGPGDQEEPDEGDLLPHVQSTVAWGRVRSRLLSATEDNLLCWWQEVRSGTHEIRILVRKGDGWVSDYPIHAAIRRNEATEAEAIVPLKQDPNEEQNLSARAEVAAIDGDDRIAIDIFDDLDLVAGRPEPAEDPESRDAVATKVLELINDLDPALANEAPHKLAPTLPWPVPGTRRAHA